MKLRYAFVMMLFLLILDEGSKIYVRLYVPMGQVTPFIPNVIDLTHVENSGVSFSFLAEMPTFPRVPLLVGISLIAVVGMLYYLIRYWRQLDVFTQFALICTIPGAMGNLIDRSVYQTVTDFMHFRWYHYSFFVNNLADCFISLGVVFFIIATFWGSVPQETPSESLTENSSQSK
ncbi:signal peptidase II [Deltaproteobacteria bacterium TL4]